MNRLSAYATECVCVIGLLLAGCKSTQTEKAAELPNKNENYETVSDADRVIEIATPVRRGDTMWGFAREIYDNGAAWDSLLHERGYDSIAIEWESGLLIHMGKFPKNTCNYRRKIGDCVVRALDRESNPNTDLISGQLISLPLRAEQARRYAARHPERELFEIRDVMSISTVWY